MNNNEDHSDAAAAMAEEIDAAAAMAEEIDAAAAGTDLDISFRVSNKNHFSLFYLQVSQFFNFSISKIESKRLKADFYQKPQSPIGEPL
jgi:hypothetical protein